MVDTRMFDTHDDAVEFAMEKANFDGMYVALIKLQSGRYITYIFDYDPTHMYDEEDDMEIFVP